MAVKSRGRAMSEMVLSSLQALQTVHGFSNEANLTPSNSSHVFESLTWRFWAKKAVVADYFGVELLMIFDFSKNDNFPAWRLGEFVVRDVYLTAQNPERDIVLGNQVPRYLSGEDFLAFLGKDFGNNSWMFKSAKDLLDMFDEYDSIAKFLGCHPIFFGK